MLTLKKINLSNKLVLPIIEGGKGISVSNGITAGTFAKNHAIGTFSGVNADFYDEKGKYVKQYYNPNLTRREKFDLLVKYAIKGAVAQAKIANDISGGNGRIHMNILWESGGAKQIIEAVLEKTKGLIHGITCGAGLPYDLAKLATKYKVYYYPIISSARAFSILWKRAYSKLHQFLGGVVYEDPWVAGGHVGLSNKEDPFFPESPLEKLKSLRTFMSEVELKDVAIVMAGGVWNLKEWENLIDNKDIGKIAFQFGSRPLVTQESPISLEWKQKLLNLTPEDVVLNRFSPTGLPSIAIKNHFLQNLINRSKRQINYSKTATDFYTEALTNKRNHKVFVEKEALNLVEAWKKEGYNCFLKTPSNTLIFVTEEEATQIRIDQKNCMGCLSQCIFSNWSESLPGNTIHRRPDPRSFCIQKTLQSVIHDGDIENNLLFAGKNAYRFSTDPLYKNGYIPTIKELVDNICIGK